MKLWRSKCGQCGLIAYVFPDQIESIKKRANLALHKYVPKDGKLTKGQKWFCIKCDANKKNPHDCFIYEELTGKKAKNLINIRKRETTLKSSGFVLPQLY
jgi:methionine salvage enolase-phosphatase E1